MWNLHVLTTVDCSLTLSWTVLLFASGLHFNSAPWPRPMPPQLKGNRWAVKNDLLEDRRKTAMFSKLAWIWFGVWIFKFPFMFE